MRECTSASATAEAPGEAALAWAADRLILERVSYDPERTIVATMQRK